MFGVVVNVASIQQIIDSKTGANRDVDQTALPHLRVLQHGVPGSDPSASG